LGAGGIALWYGSPRDHSPTVAIQVLGILITTGIPAGVYWWALTIEGLAPVALAFGIGLQVNALLAGVTFDAEVWLHTFEYPMTILILALAALTKRRWPSVGAAVILAALSASGGVRSAVGAVGLGLGLWLAAPLFRRMRFLQQKYDLRPIAYIGSFLIGSIAVGAAATRTLVSGLLGSRIQEDTLRQIASGGSLLTGGRYEWLVSTKLFRQMPWGFGPGAIPTQHDTSLVAHSLTDAGVTPSWQYVYTYMLGSASPFKVEPTRFKLHSVVADLWVNFGPIGAAAFVVLVLVLCVMFLARNVTTMAATPLLPFVLLCFTLWDLFFSPIYSNLILVVFSAITLGFLTTIGSPTKTRPPISTIAMRHRRA